MQKHHATLSLLRTDHGFVNSPRKLDEAELNDRVQRYRDGDLSQRDPLIEAHIRVAVQIAVAYPNHDDDVIGVALLALVNAVDQAREALTDNLITPYIKAVIRDRIVTAIASSRAVYMPARTFRQKASQGHIQRHGDNSPDISPVLASVYYIRDFSDADQKYTIPEAKPESVSLEFKEALELAIKSDIEARLIALRAEGYIYEDMEVILKMSKTHIARHINRVKERFDRLYA